MSPAAALDRPSSGHHDDCHLVLAFLPSLSVEGAGAFQPSRSSPACPGRRNVAGQPSAVRGQVTRTRQAEAASLQSEGRAARAEEGSEDTGQGVPRRPGARSPTLRPRDAEKPDRFLLRDLGRLLEQVTLNPNGGGVREEKGVAQAGQCLFHRTARSWHRVSRHGGACSASISRASKRLFIRGVAMVAVTGVAREAPVAYREAHPAQTFERP